MPLASAKTNPSFSPSMIEKENLLEIWLSHPLNQRRSGTLSLISLQLSMQRGMIPCLMSF